MFAGPWQVDKPIRSGCQGAVFLFVPKQNVSTCRGPRTENIPTIECARLMVRSTILGGIAIPDAKLYFKIAINSIQMTLKRILSLFFSLFLCRSMKIWKNEDICVELL